MSMSPSRPRSSLKTPGNVPESSKDGGRGRVSFSDGGAKEASSRSPSPDVRSGKSSRSPSPSRKESPNKGKMLFSEEDFERKKDTTDVDKRKKLAARMRGLAQEPKDWSRAELLDRLGRFAKFNQDKSSNICELKVKEGISMSVDEVKILNELFKRVSEVTK
eukprot:gene27003-32624_t